MYIGTRKEKLLQKFNDDGYINKLYISYMFCRAQRTSTHKIILNSIPV